ncbi:MAG: DNA primase [Gammaproteobacteria bacterium]|nr:MAG: DNA primase [Gammaproteobacteria bacterium]
MGGRIPPEFIDELLSRADIVEIIDSRVPLKKAGREYKGCCPFHDEKTPSFTVSPGKQFYHCFGCGAHGTAIGFLMDYDNLGFRETIEELAGRYSMIIPETASQDNSAERRKQADLYGVLDLANKHFQRRLRETESAKNYLIERGLSGEIAARYELGFARESWDDLLNSLTSKNISRKDLATAGLTSSNDQGRVYDKFRDRIIFPIHDQRGRVIAFGGRILGDGEPKYLNSPESPVFHKGKELYGLYQALNAIGKQNQSLVVEGYMDVIALAQTGIENVVAALGTATTPGHIELLFRRCDEIIFCFDGDRAGRQAAWRALENSLPSMRDGKQASFLFLPDGEDPDSYVRKLGHDGFFEQLRENPLPLPEYMLNHLAEDIDLSRMDGKAKLAALARPLLNSLPRGTLKALLMQKLAEITAMDEQGLADLMLDQPKQQPGRQKVASPNSKKHNLIGKTLTLLLNQPELGREVSNLEYLRLLELAGMDVLSEIIDLIKGRPNLTSSAIIERFRQTVYYDRLCELASSGIELGDVAVKTEFLDAINRLHLMSIDQETKKITSRSTKLSEKDKMRLRSLQQERLALKH